MNLLSWLGEMFSSGGSKTPKAPGLHIENGKATYIPDPLGRLDQGTWKPIDQMPDPFGRLPALGSFGGELPEMENTGVPLLRPVGMTGDNRPDDVMKVENLLGQTGHLDLGATGGPTGYYGTRTEQAVKGFQKENGLKVDGLLNPGGETIRALGAAGSGEASPGMRSSRHRSDPIGYPQTGGRAPVGSDAGTGTRQPKPGEKQVAQAAALAEPAAASLLAILAGKKLSDIVAGPPASEGSKSGDGGSAIPVPKLTPEAALRLFATNPAFISKSIYDRFRAGNDSGTGQQQFDAIDKPLPNRTEFPAAAPKQPNRTETPADPPHLPDRLENPIPKPEKPDPETFPDQSGAFDDFNIVETKQLPRPNDLSAGDLPAGTTRNETARLPSGLRELVEEHFLGNGVETHADKGGSIIEGNLPAVRGERTFEQMVRTLGGDPSRIKAEPMKGIDGTIRTFENKKEGYTINWRTKSSRRSGGKPTLEIQRLLPGQRGSTYYRYKMRYNP